MSATNGDYFSSRPTVRTRPAPSGRAATAASPRSPRTPLLGRSISSQFGSPGSFRVEQEEIIIYELSPRTFSAGFAGEGRPRCIIPFTPDSGRRLGDYRAFRPDHVQISRKLQLAGEWTAGHELYRSDLASLDLGLVEDKLDRAFRTAHTDSLQLDSKPRKAVLIVPSLLPTPLLEIALRVLFSNFTQSPSITVLTPPVLNCIGAGLRNALVVDIGWDETVVTAVGECKEVLQRRSIRAGKFLTQQMANLIEHEAPRHPDQGPSDTRLTFSEADELTRRLAWCQIHSEHQESDSVLQLPLPGSDPPIQFSLSFDKMAEPAERTFFPADRKPAEYDDHDFPLDMIVYRVLLAIPVDLRAVCLSRIIVTGTASSIPGIKRRLLHEINLLADSRGWDSVESYGSASAKRQQVLKERSANIATRVPDQSDTASTVALSPMKMPLQDSISAADRVHDDIQDPVTLKAERDAINSKKDLLPKTSRGVETLGSWAGASVVISLRVKGAHEIERDDFLKYGLRNVAFNGI